MSLENVDTAIGFAVIMLLLSLVVMVIVQAIIAIGGLRGANLKWGVERLLELVDPRLGAKASQIAEAALRHPSVAGIAKRKATAVRPEELIRVLNELAAKDPDLKHALQSAGRAATGLAAEQAAQIKTWFESVVDRTTDRFILQTRWLAVGVAFVLALGLHIDALALLRRMSQDSEFRSKVLATADGTMQSAEGVFALSVERQALASAALSQARSDTTADSAALADIPAGLLSRAQGERWLRARLARSSRGPATLAAYHKSYDSTTKEWIGGLRDNTATIHGLLQETSFQLIPSPYPGLFEYGSLPAFLGTVMTALLLTLGAPFWFNLLRQASNLRPAIAQKVAKESGQ